MARITVTNKKDHGYMVPAPIRSVVGPQETKTFDGISVTDLESSLPFVAALESGTITVEVLSDPGIPDSVEVGNTMAESHVNTLKMTEELHIYVDGDNGRDAAPGTERAPLLTLAAAYELIPEFVTYRVWIYLAAFSGTYEISTLEKRLSANIWVIGEGDTTLLSGTAVAGSLYEVETTGMTIDEYRGKTVEILTGDAAGDRRTIRNNTATLLQPVCEFSAVIAASDSFRVFEPLVEVFSNVPYVALNSGNLATLEFEETQATAGLFFENLSWTPITHPSGNNSRVHFYGVEFNANLTYLHGRSSWFFGQDRFAYQPTDTAPKLDRSETVSDMSWYGWGVYHTAGKAIGCTNHGTIGGFLVAGCLFIRGGQAKIIGGSFDGLLPPSAIIVVSGKDNIGSAVQLLADSNPLDILLSADVNKDVIFVSGPNGYVECNELTITALGTGRGIFVKNRSTVELWDVAITSAGVGIAVKYGAELLYNSGTISATGNDIELGNTPTVTDFSAIPVAGDFIVEAAPSDGSILRRYTTS